MKSVALLAALSLALIAAPARAQHGGPHQVTVSAVGTYDLQVEMAGQAQSSVLTLWKEKDGTLGGTLTLHGNPAKVDNVALKGNEMTVQVALPHGALKLSLTFKTGDELNGSFTMEGMGNGTIAGTRRKS
jgi:hypothetical protein